MPDPEPQEETNDSLLTLVRALQALCDDEWLRDRDRLMDLPGSRYKRKNAAGVIERAAYQVRLLIEGMPGYDEIGSGGAFLDWMRNGRDRGAEAEGANRG